MDTELVSIIVPVYNTEDYLPQCIDSLLNQTYKTTEIILVNDGSTDNSLKICQRYSEQYSNVRIINQRNKGVSAARNCGISQSCGVYLTFVDSDDILCPDAIEIMYRLISEHSADMVSAEMKDESKPWENQNNSVRILTELQTVQMAMREISFSACAKLYRKSSIDGIIFTEGKKINEDGYFVFECCMRQIKVVETNQVVYQFTQREGSSSRVAFSDKFLDMLYFLEKKKLIITDYYPQYCEQMHRVEIRTYLNLLQLLCHADAHEYGTVINQCCTAIKKSPGIHMNDLRRYEKRLYYAVRLGGYWLYRFAINNLRKRKS